SLKCYPKLPRFEPRPFFHFSRETPLCGSHQLLIPRRAPIQPVPAAPGRLGRTLALLARVWPDGKCCPLWPTAADTDTPTSDVSALPLLTNIVGHSILTNAMRHDISPSALPPVELAEQSAAVPTT